MATSTLGNGTLVLAGTTSGTTTVTATAVAGTTTLTLPAATDTLVGKATTDTLTNKTLTGAVMNGTLGATTPSTGAFTTLSSTGNSYFATSSGNVGIGTSSPAYKLDVAGTASSQLRLQNSDATSYASMLFTGTGRSFSIGVGNASETGIGVANQFYIYDITAAQTRLRLDSSGNLGLGVTPSAWGGSYKAIQVNSTGALVSNGSNATGVGHNYYFDGTNNTYLTTGAANLYLMINNEHRWYNAASGTAGNAITFTQAMTLDASSNLLVNTTASVGGAARIGVLFAGNATNGINIQDSTTTSGAVFQQFSNSSGTAIGNISRVTTTNAVVYNTTSDYRLKTVIGPVSGAGARIDALKPVDYQWKDGNQHARGFLAHEFQEIYASSVSGNKDAVDANGNPVYQAMQASTSEVIADLVAEIQSLRKRLAAAGI